MPFIYFSFKYIVEIQITNIFIRNYAINGGFSPEFKNVLPLINILPDCFLKINKRPAFNKDFLAKKNLKLIRMSWTFIKETRVFSNRDYRKVAR
jgi:hypothetical protein